MRVAQRLYENGYITYMRTDSTTLSETALTAARAQARELYGDAYVPAEAAQLQPQGQERAGGARGDPPGRRHVPHARARSPASCPRDEFRLYELIWQRTVASQMADAVGTTVSVRHRRHVGRPASRPSSPPPAGRSPSPASCAPTSRAPTSRRRERTTREKRLPQLAARRRARPRASSRPTGHTTIAAGPLHRGRRWSRRWRSSASAGRRPTPRSCRRSRTAATSGRRARRWSRPGWRSRSSACSRSYFGRLVDYGFTASVENDLDEIAGGERVAGRVAAAGSTSAATPTARRRRRQRISAQGGLKKLIAERLDEIDARGVNSIPLGTDTRRRGAGRPVRPVPAARRRRRTPSARRCPRTWRRTS